MFQNPVVIFAVAGPAIMIIAFLVRFSMPRWLTDRLGIAHLTLKDWSW
jgi:hypothetical protein